VPDVVVVGSIALDSLQTPFGRVDEVAGGSATYFSLAARHFASVGIVGVAGEDFPRAHLDGLVERGIDITGLEVRSGATFRWAGRYENDLNVAHTLDTQLNVFAAFRPRIPESYRTSHNLFLGNIAPSLQREVLDQVERPAFTAMDTMNFWIQGNHTELSSVMRRVDAVLINEAEARQFAGSHNIAHAARYIQDLGPRIVVVKKGEYGSVLFHRDEHFVAPAFPLEDVRDPTGAGDSYAGAFVGYLVRARRIDDVTLRQAVVVAGVVASYTCEEFGVGRLTTLTRDEIANRVRLFRKYTEFDEEMF